MVKTQKHASLRSICVRDILNLQSLADKAISERSILSRFKARYQDLEGIKEDFLKHHNTVISSLITESDGNLEDEFKIREDFLESYYFIKSVHADISESEHKAEITDKITNQHSHIMLPTLELTKFNGDYKSFSSFIDLFDALVHNNYSLSAIEKFNYLISSLSGPPLNLVRTLSLCADNYQIAYDQLKRRYQNERLRAQALWNELENAPSLQSENAESLRKLLDTFSENLAGLSQMNFPVESWNFVLSMMLIKRLDHATVTSFELNETSIEIPDYRELLSFLERHCTALETLKFIRSSHGDINSHNNMSNTRQRFQQDRKPYHQSTTLFTNISSSRTCLHCKGKHTIYRCNAFSAKSPNQRYDFCRASHLCFNCLSASHGVRSCQSAYKCKKCGSGEHHTLLHVDKMPLSRTQVGLSKKTSPPCSPSSPQLPAEQVHSVLSTASFLVETSNKRSAPVSNSTLWRSRDSRNINSRQSHPSKRQQMKNPDRSSDNNWRSISNLEPLPSKSILEPPCVDLYLPPPHPFRNKPNSHTQIGKLS